MVVPYAGNVLTGDVQLLGCAHERVVRFGEEPLDVRGEEGVIAHLDASVEHASHRCTRRGDRAPRAKELVPEIGESHSHTTRRQCVQSVLELLDVRIGRVD